MWLTCGFHVTCKFLYFACFRGRKTKLPRCIVAKIINRNCVCITSMKNWITSISPPVLIANVCLICIVSETASKKYNDRVTEGSINKYPENSKICKNSLEDFKRVKQYFPSLLTKPKQLPLLCVISQKSWPRRSSSPLMLAV